MASGLIGIAARTETCPRPPHSGATCYVYERDGAPNTKLEVCDRFDASAVL